MDASHLELLYKGIISIAVGFGLYILKDFKEDFRRLTKSLTDVTLSLQTLITKDTHKEEAIADLKVQILRHDKKIGLLQIKIAILEQEKPKEEK